MRAAVQTAIRYLNVTSSGRQWMANLYSNVFRAGRGGYRPTNITAVDGFNGDADMASIVLVAGVVLVRAGLSHTADIIAQRP